MPTSGNPFAYALPAIAVTLVVLYYLYGAVDRLGLSTQDAEGVVISKAYTPGSTTYNTNVAGGRSWVQASRNPDMYSVELQVEGETAGGLVDKKLYDVLKANDRVRLRVGRTRLTKRLIVREVALQ